MPVDVDGLGAFTEPPLPEGVSRMTKTSEDASSGNDAARVGNALFLDFDGTLIDIASTPDAVTVPDDLGDLLGRLDRALDGALAIVTGRRVGDIDRLLSPLRLVTAGGHGAEYRTSREEIVRPAALPIDAALVEKIDDLARRYPGLLIEPKEATIAVHFRLFPEAARAVEADLRRILADGPDHLELSLGRKVFEICPRHVSKGAAIELLAGLSAFRGRRPIMIGDDVSDASAFEAVDRLGGLSLRVAGETYPREVADFDGPHAVRRWLWDLLARIER